MEMNHTSKSNPLVEILRVLTVGVQQSNLHLAKISRILEKLAEDRDAQNPRITSRSRSDDVDLSEDDCDDDQVVSWVENTLARYAWSASKLSRSLSRDERARFDDFIRRYWEIKNIGRNPIPASILLIVSTIKRFLLHEGQSKLYVKSVERREVRNDQVRYLLGFEGCPPDPQDDSNWVTREQAPEDIRTMIDAFDTRRLSKGRDRSDSITSTAVASKRKDVSGSSADACSVESTKKQKTENWKESTDNTNDDLVSEILVRSHSDRVKK